MKLIDFKETRKTLKAAIHSVPISSLSTEQLLRIIGGDDDNDKDEKEELLTLHANAKMTPKKRKKPSSK
jgi:hypothetical protein